MITNLNVIDPSDMGKNISSFVEQLEVSTAEPIDISLDFDRITICGMGGSAIAGDILSDYSFGLSDVPITVIRGVQMPNWARENTLAIITSYSGNTRETLELYRQAMGQGCNIIGMSSGGHLEEYCREDGVFHLKVPTGIQPRCALGYLLGYLANLTESLGVSPSRSEIRGLLPTLAEIRDLLMLDDEENPARELALKLHGKIPVIYAPTYMNSSAIRWKNQLNENSKMIAFNGTIPEFNHNEIVGWLEGGYQKPCVPVFLYDSNAPELLRCMMEASLDTMREKGLEVEVVEIEGENVLEKNLRSIMYGDFTSLYLAYINHVDPSPVNSISSLKERLLAALRHGDERKASKAGEEGGKRHHRHRSK